MTASDQPSGPEVRQLDAAGLKTTYRRKGVGEPMLVLADEALSGTWLPFHDALAERFDVILPDHPGFGGTPMPAGLRDFTDVVIHYDALLSTLGIDRVHLVGASLGGWMAAEFAVFHPSRLSSLSLVGALGLRVVGDPVADMFRWTPRQRALALLGSDDGLQALVGFGENEVEGMLEQYGESIALARLAWNPRYDIRLDARLARVSAPALVVQGSEDAVVSAAHARAYAELLPNAALEIVEPADGRAAPHLVHAAQPARVAKLIISTAGAAGGSDRS